MPSPQSSVASIHHLHPIGDVCPTCDQPIPHERAEEVTRRIGEQERRQASELTTKLKEEFDSDMAEAAERMRLETEDKLAAARLEATTAAEAAAKDQIEAAVAASQAAIEGLKAKTEEAETLATATKVAQAEFQGQLEQARRHGHVEVERVRTEAAESLTKACEEATRLATEAAAGRLQAAEAATLAAEQTGAELQAKLEDAGRQIQAAVDQTRTEVTAAAQTRIDEVEQGKRLAEEQAASALRDVQLLRASQEAQLTDALKEQREALEADKSAAVNAERSIAFEAKQKLSEKVDALQRALDKKTAEELGEGAEVDLFEALRAEFEDDRIQRVNKGQPGADILHTVIHNGHACGTIIYDSKNHAGWRNEFVTKLRADQLAAGAEHAILSTLKFPQGGRQVHLQDGVILANPARVVALAQMVRQHMVQTHTLRISSQERAEKTAALYDFITSDQCGGMFARLETNAQALLDIQVSERAAHERVWKQQGLAIRASQKVQAELRNQIDSIIGTATVPESPQ